MNVKRIFAMLFGIALLCGITTPANAQSVLDKLKSAVTNSSSSSSSDDDDEDSSSSSSSKLGSVISSVVSGLTSSSASSLEGTWEYSEPAVSFESDNLLAKAGGSVASSSVEDQLAPYYEKVGIKEGSFSLTLNSDDSCSYSINGKEYSGTYTVDEDAGTLTIKSGKISLPKASYSVSGSKLELTFDASKILSVVQSLSSMSSNSQLSTLSTIADQYDGMSVGFTFKK